MSKPILCLDFDGVCHSYTSGWQGADLANDLPVSGLEAFLEQALKHFEVYIYSSRSRQPGGIEAMQLFFYRWTRKAIRDALHYPTEKPPAFLTIDDRVWCFTGEWPDPERLLAFRPWHKQ